jgi:HSP20 family protein
MKKYLNTLLFASLLTTALNADAIAVTNPYDKEFAKMNQYFNSLVESHFNNVKLNNFNYPRMDIQDTPKEMILKFDLAGVPKENIKLSIDDNNILTLQGEKKESKDENTTNSVKKEIFYGSFERVVKLPDNIEQDKLTTSYKNGILTVKVPKKEIKKPKAKVIPIQ